MAQNPGTFDLTITDRIGFTTAVPKSGGTGDFDRVITDRLFWQDYVEVEEVGGTLSVSLDADDPNTYMPGILIRP